MLSLLVIGSLVCLASSAYVGGGGHSPILGSGRYVAGVSAHGDHLDAHVKTNVVGAGGQVHTIHEHVPIPSSIQNPIYNGGHHLGRRRYGLFNNGYNGYNRFNHYNNGYNHYNNGFNHYNNGINHYNSGFNNYRQPYVTTNFNSGFNHGHGHIHRKKRAALLPVARYPTNHINKIDTNPTITSTIKDSALTVTGHADSLNSIHTKDVNGLSESSNNIASTDPEINNLIQTESTRSLPKPKVVRTVTIQPAEFTIGQPADSVTPLTSPTDLYSAFGTGPSADNALLNSVDMQIQGSNMQMRGGNMQMTGGNMQMNVQMTGGNMRMGAEAIGGNMQMTGGDMQRNGGSRQMIGRDMQMRDRNMHMRDRNMKMRDRNMQMRGRNRQINGGTRPMGRGSRRVVNRNRNVNGGNRSFNVGRGQFNDGTRRFRNRPIFNSRRQYNRNTNSRTSSTRQFNQLRRPGLVNNYDSTMNARSTECGSCMKKNSFLGLPSEHVCRCEPFKLYFHRAVKPN